MQFLIFLRYFTRRPLHSHLLTMTERRRYVSAKWSCSSTLVNQPNLHARPAKLPQKRSNWSANWYGTLLKRYQPAIRSPDTGRSSLLLQSSTRVFWQINAFCLECSPLYTGQIRCFHTFRSQCINTPWRPAPQYLLMISITTSFSLQLLVVAECGQAGKIVLHPPAQHTPHLFHRKT